MNTTQLECFVNLASTLSFMKTAELMSLTQPAVSKQLQSLERELQTRLFERTTRSVTLTEAGAQFLPEAEEMLRTWYRSRDLLRKTGQEQNRRLRIGYSDPHALFSLGKILTEMERSLPGAIPEFSLGQTDTNLYKLERGDLDLVFSMRDQRYSSDRVVFMRLATDVFCCTARKDYPLFAGLGEDVTEVTSDVFLPYPQVMSIPPYLWRTRYLAHHTLIPVNEHVPLLQCTYVSESYTLLIAGMGYSLIPGHLLIPHPLLRSVGWKGSPQAALGLYYRRGAAKEHPWVRQFLLCARQFTLERMQW